MKRLLAFIIPFIFIGVAVDAKKPIAKHVVLIGFDGWGAKYYDRSDVPTIKELAANGCYTLEKRSVLPSASAINWASMFNGCPTEVHGYLHWGSRAPELEQPTGAVKEHNIIPTIFQILRDQRPNAEIACFYNGPVIHYVVDTLAMSSFGITPGAEELCDRACEYIKESRPMLAAVCFNSPDHEGHASGWGSEEYLEKMHQLDGCASRIIEAVRQAGILDDTIFIVTADHGGIKKGHGKTSMEEMLTPLIFSGKGVKKGAKITDLVMQYDVASTIAYILGIEQPQLWVGRPVKSAFK